jgi:hypothetical protein
MHPVKWAFGTIALEGENLVILQNNINKKWFRKPEQLDIRIEYPIRILIGMEISREDDLHIPRKDNTRLLVLRARGRDPRGLHGISDSDALLELAEYLSTWVPVTWDGDIWQLGQADVRASASPIGMVTGGGERRALRCSQCGGPVDGRARFCRSCGAPLA